VSLGSFMATLEAFMQALPSRIERRVNRFVSALRDAAHDIYRFAKMVSVSTFKTILAVRLVFYVLFGFAFLFSIGIELVESNLGLELKVVGWLCIAIGAIVIVVWGVRLVPVLWRASQEEEASTSPRRIPILFFLVSVVLPVAIILFITVGTSIQFRSLPLNFAQSKVRASVAFTESTISKWSRKFSRETPPPTLAVRVTPPNPQREEPPKPQPQPIIIAPTQPPVVETFHARVTCEPELVHTRDWVTDPNKPENKVDMKVDSIDMDDDHAILHVAVAIHDGEEYALLKAATYAYITDNNGNRYDLSQDDAKGYPHSGYRELKFGEIARLDLQFPKFEKIPKFIYFSHPQFPVLKVNTAWYRVKHRTDASAPTRR
jgi:hypothetical protein